jgi:hypothetical protein
MDREPANRSPYHLSLRAWGTAFRDLEGEIKRDNVSMVASSLAFYGFLAIFPGLIALVSLYGLFFNPEDVEMQVRPLSQLLPPAAAAHHGTAPRGRERREHRPARRAAEHHRRAVERLERRRRADEGREPRLTSKRSRAA